MVQRMAVFTGKTAEAEGTILPQLRKWLKESSQDYSAPNEHTVMLFLNCPTIGVMSATQRSWFLNCICNILADWPRNGICFVIHPNRAQQETRPGTFSTAVKPILLCVLHVCCSSCESATLGRHL